EDGIRDDLVTGVQTCALPIWEAPGRPLDQRLLRISVAALALVFLGFVSGLDLAWTALAGAALVMVLAGRDTHEVLKLVDWHLLRSEERRVGIEVRSWVSVVCE